MNLPRIGHRDSLGGAPYHFFEFRSLRTELSSMASARSFVTVRLSPPVEDFDCRLHSGLLRVTPGQELVDPIDLVI